MTEAPQILLRHHLKQLRLPTFQGEYAKQAQLCAAENKDHIQYLARLCEMELIERERRMIERRIKAAKFPSTKSLDSFDFKIIPSLNKPLTMDLARCDYRPGTVRHGQNTYRFGTWSGRMPTRAKGALHHGCSTGA
jgi:DNA replication protein DnaC